MTQLTWDLSAPTTKPVSFSVAASFLTSQPSTLTVPMVVTTDLPDSACTNLKDSPCLVRKSLARSQSLNLLHGPTKICTWQSLAATVRQDLCDRLTGKSAPYNQIFSTNGIASTTGTVIAAALGYKRIDNLTDVQIGKIKQAHLLLVMFNALQPGVFSLSGWDLLGMLTINPKEITSLLATGDTRWIHRSAYDLMGVQPDAVRSASGMPQAVSMYGPLPQQLKDPKSFVSQLRRILQLRKRYGMGFRSLQVESILSVLSETILLYHRPLLTGRASTILLTGSEWRMMDVPHTKPAAPLGPRVLFYGTYDPFFSGPSTAFTRASSTSSSLRSV